MKPYNTKRMSNRVVYIRGLEKQYLEGGNRGMIQTDYTNTRENISL